MREEFAGRTLKLCSDSGPSKGKAETGHTTFSQLVSLRGNTCNPRSATEWRMEEGDVNPNGQELVRKTDAPSTTHPFATIWGMRCQTCGGQYGSNSCDAHIRRCPHCNPEAAPGEPV